MNARLLLIFLLLITASAGKAQNLVPNGDFEQYSGCPTDYAQFDSLLSWLNINDNVLAYGSPDYFNQCSGASNVGVPSNIFGFQQAHSGVAYSGIVLKNILTIPDYREYMEVPLSSTLVAGNCYYFQMYMSLSDTYAFTSDDVGVYFSDTLFAHINNYFRLPFTPQISNTQGIFPDNINWTLVSGNYTATGGENYLLIGNFLNDNNTNTILVNSSAQYNGVYIYIDDVSLTPCTGIEEQNTNEAITIYPNPVKELLVISDKRTGIREIEIYDLFGRRVLKSEVGSQRTEMTINISKLSPGIYFLKAGNEVRKFVKE
jgi:hypothetical protein